MNNELATIPHEFTEIAQVLQLDAQLLGDYSVKAVNGRNLQEALGSTSNHTKWGGDQVRRCNLKQNKDFEVISQLGKNPELGGRPELTYIFTVDAAKKVAGKSGSSKSDLIWEYFLHMEKVAQGAYRGNLPAQLPGNAPAHERALHEYDYTTACMMRSIEGAWGRGYVQKMIASVAQDVDSRHGTQISRLIPAPTALPGQKEEVDISRGEHLLRQTVGSKEINVSQFKDMFFLKSTTPLNETLVALGYQTVLRAPGARSISGYQLVPGKERYATQIPLSGGNLAGQFKIAAWILNSFSDAEKEKIKIYLVEHYKKNSFKEH